MMLHQRTHKWVWRTKPCSPSCDCGLGNTHGLGDVFERVLLQGSLDVGVELLVGHTTYLAGDLGWDLEAVGIRKLARATGPRRICKPATFFVFQVNGGFQNHEHPWRL
jgi:hypothetical protein